LLSPLSDGGDRKRLRQPTRKVTHELGEALGESAGKRCFLSSDRQRKHEPFYQPRFK
jgi:hypothetical protein